MRRLQNPWIAAAPYLVAAFVPLLMAADCATIEPTIGAIQTEVFDGSCAFGSCHGSPTFEADLDLETSAAQSCVNLVGVESAENPGEMRVIAGDPDNSLLYQALLTEIGDVRVMPPGGANDRLPDNEIEAIRQWIEDGASCE